MNTKAIKELKEILARDYDISIADDQAQELGVSLLRLTRVAIAALARVDEARSFTADKNNLNKK